MICTKCGWTPSANPMTPHETSCALIDVHGRVWCPACNYAMIGPTHSLTNGVAQKSGEEMKPHWNEPVNPAVCGNQTHGITKLEVMAMHMMQTQRRREDDGSFVTAEVRAKKAVHDAKALLAELDRVTDEQNDRAP